MERIQKLIAASGLTSRRKAEELIKEGRVTVNGKTASLGDTAEADDEIRVDDTVIRMEKKVYYLLNKPVHTLCTVKDDRGRKTVLDCFPKEKNRIYPVGRLDYDTTGVLILTNDGGFANAMMHPRHHVPKTYRATVNGLFNERMAKAVESGIPLEDGMTLPAKVRILLADERQSIVEVTIFEGRNREVKRMMEYFHCRVTRLDRIAYDFLTYANLKRGESRILSQDEVFRLINDSQSMSTPAARSSSGSGSM